MCESLGHSVEEAAFTYDAEAANGALAAVMSVNVAFAVDARLAALGRELRDDDLEPFTRVLYDGGRAMTGTTVIGALQQLERTSREVAPFFEQYDLLLTPTLSIRVPELGWVDTSRPETMVNASAFSAFTGVFNTTGHPAMSVPAGVDGNGLPIGVQFVARLGDEATLLRLASASRSPRRGRPRRSRRWCRPEFQANNCHTPRESRRHRRGRRGTALPHSFVQGGRRVREPAST